MQFRYPARLQADPSGAIVVSFRDFPECLTSGTDQAVALVEARDALEEAVAGRIDDDEPVPTPSRRRNGEHLIGVPPDMATKAAFVLALREAGCLATHSHSASVSTRRWCAGCSTRHWGRRHGSGSLFWSPCGG